MTSDSTLQPVSFEYAKEKVFLSQIIASWKGDETPKVVKRREVREHKVNVLEKRVNKEILEDETYIPDRTVNLNIKRGKIPYIEYVTRSQQILVMTDLNDPAKDTEEVSRWFTRGMRFPHWKIPWYRHIDSIHTHGGSAVEVVYDESKPLNCAIEFIERNDLIFPIKTKDIQACPRILRRYELTIVQLEEFARAFEFDQVAVDTLKNRAVTATDNRNVVVVYKVLMKKDGIVYNAWFSDEQGLLGWLREPVEHQIGLFEIDMQQMQIARQLPTWGEERLKFLTPLKLTKYPIFWFRYEETENEYILETSGRVALDIHVQEAATALMTNTVNASTRASRFYPTAKGEPGDSSKIMELGQLKPGYVMSGDITVFQPNWPNPLILSVLQALDVRKAQESGNTDFAAIARQDANKTATEMNLARQQAGEFSFIELASFASDYLDVYALCFLIAQQQALLDLAPGPNDIADLFGNFHFSPAGDVEILQREQEKTNAKEFLTLAQGTPLALHLLSFLLESYFPERAKEWKEQIDTSAQQAQIITQMADLLESLLPTIPDERSRAQLSVVVNTARSMVAASTNATSAQVP